MHHDVDHVRANGGRRPRFVVGGRPAVSLILAVAAILALGGCGARQSAVLGPGPAISLSLSIDVLPALLSYARDLAAASGSSAVDPLDPRAVESALGDFPGLVVESASSPGPTRLDLSFRTDDVRRVIAARPEVFSGVVAFSTAGDSRTLRLDLDPAAFRKLSALAPPRFAPALELLLPAVGTSASEYKEQLSWALEDYAKPGEVAAALSALRVRVEVRAGGPVLAQTGGTIRNGAVVFDFAALDLLTGTRRLSVTY